MKKIELVKREEFNEPAYYYVTIGGKMIDSSFGKNLDEVQYLYEQLIKDPNLMDTKTTILKSDKIVVSSKD
jgi:surfactin synthase thioesterase subunit